MLQGSRHVPWCMIMTLVKYQKDLSDVAWYLFVSGRLPQAHRGNASVRLGQLGQLMAVRKCVSRFVRRCPTFVRRLPDVPTFHLWPSGLIWPAGREALAKKAARQYAAWKRRAGAVRRQPGGTHDARRSQRMGVSSNISSSCCVVGACVVGLWFSK